MKKNNPVIVAVSVKKRFTPEIKVGDVWYSGAFQDPLGPLTVTVPPRLTCFGTWEMSSVTQEGTELKSFCSDRGMTGHRYDERENLYCATREEAEAKRIRHLEFVRNKAISSVSMHFQIDFE